MCNKKRLGQTAALLLVGMAVGLAGGAFAANSIVPVNWNVMPITDGAYRETFESALTWDRAVVTAAADSRATVVRRGLGATWFPDATSTKAMKIPDDASYTNTLKYEDNSSVSFATSPVFVDMRIQFTAYEGEPSIGTARLAVFVSAADKIHVVHNGGTSTNTWPGNDLLSAWHQLTVRLESGGKCAVLLDDVTVTNNLTPKDAVTELQSLEFANSGYVDELYVSHGNPNYAGGATPGSIPAGANVTAGTVSSVTTNWLANYYNDGRLAANVSLSAINLDRAYLLNIAPTDSSDPVTSVTFGVKAIDLVSPTSVTVTCRLTVNGSNREDPINGKLQLQGKDAIGKAYETLSGVVSPQSTDFDGGLATYTFTVPSGMKFFKAQIVE